MLIAGPAFSRHRCTCLWALRDPRFLFDSARVSLWQKAKTVLTSALSVSSVYIHGRYRRRGSHRVVFLGAIGGFVAMGIIGLFVGAIVLSVGYKLFLAWLERTVAVERGL